MCPLACRYCYAEDLMRNKNKEPKNENINRIAKAILFYKPLAVVLTGGDPLCSPYLLKAIRLLSGHTGIIVDTSANTFTTKHLSVFKKYNVVVRVSFDSEQPKINQKQRPIWSKDNRLQHNCVYTLDAAVKTLCDCLRKGITVVVQSVVTQYTANDLPALGNKLYRLGVHAWRVFKVQPSEKNMDGYKELIGSEDKQNRLYPHIFTELNKAYRNVWKKQMSLQITQNEIPNAVILVSPDGIFYTESNVRPGKVVLDEKNPTLPRPDILRNKVNIHAHAERYLNLTYLSSTFKKL